MPQIYASDAAFSAFSATFRSLAWMNATAAFLFVAFYLSLIGGELAAPDLRLPVVLFLAGFVAAGLGMLAVHLM